MSPYLEALTNRLEAKAKADHGHKKIIHLLREAGATGVADHLEALVNEVREDALKDVAFLRARVL
jgi:hypothetical protein